jgi:hypothetical protein
MFILHLEREYAKDLDCNCLTQASKHVKDKGVNVLPTYVPEVKQAIDLQKHYGLYKYPEVAPPAEPDQAKELACIGDGLADRRFRGVKHAALKAQGAHKAELKVRAKFREICPDLVVESNDTPSTSTWPGAPLVDDDEEMGEPLD